MGEWLKYLKGNQSFLESWQHHAATRVVKLPPLYMPSPLRGRAIVWGVLLRRRWTFLQGFEIGSSAAGGGASEHPDAMVQTIPRGIGQDGDAPPEPSTATECRAIHSRKILYRYLIKQKPTYLTETLINSQRECWVWYLCNRLANAITKV